MRFHTFRAALGFLAIATQVATAQVGQRDESGIRVAIAPMLTTMYGHFRGTEPHLYQSQRGFDAGPGVGVVGLVDWRGVGINAELSGTGHRFGQNPAYGIYFRAGVRYHPGFSILGFEPWLDASVFGLSIFTDMNPSDVPPEVGQGFPTCCYDSDYPGTAQETIAGHSFAVWLERDLGRGFSFWTRIGSDIGRVTDMRVGDTTYMGNGSRGWIAQRINVGVQYAFWPLR